MIFNLPWLQLSQEGSFGIFSFLSTLNSHIWLLLAISVTLNIKLFLCLCNNLSLLLEQHFISMLLHNALVIALELHSNELSFCNKGNSDCSLFHFCHTSIIMQL
jgi:hypothetical protein